jgi:hypothetical protein
MLGSRRVFAVVGLWFAVVVAIVLAPLGTGPASADTPDRVGWWNKANMPPLSPPVLDPSAPAGSLQIAADPTGEAAVAGLHWALPAGTGTKVTLTSTRPLVLPPTAVIQLCEILAPWDPVENGVWAERPAYGGRCFGATVEGDTLVWDLPTDLIFGELGLDMAIVPAASEVPYQVTLAPPDDASLVVTSPAQSEPEPTTEPQQESGPEPTTVVEPTITIEDFGPQETERFFVPGPTTVTVPAAVPKVTPTTQPFRQIRTSAPAPFKDTTRGERVMALCLLGAMLSALLLGGGRAVAGPRLLGPLSTGRVPVSGSSGMQVGGLGRFARPRTARPRRLT